MASGYLPNPANSVSSGELIAELSARAPKVGANTGVWPGLTIYRFTGPIGPTWEEIQSLSLCIVAQGRKTVTLDGQTYTYDPFRYLVLGNHLHFQAEGLEASISRPFLSLVLQINPALVRQVSSDMLERRTTAFRSRETEALPVQPACISAMDTELLGVVMRFPARRRDRHRPAGARAAVPAGAGVPGDAARAVRPAAGPGGSRVGQQPGVSGAGVRAEPYVRTTHRRRHGRTWSA